MALIYLLIYRVFILPLSLLFIFSFGLFFKKIRTGLKVRIQKKYKPPYPKLAKHCEPIWIHCSSGEFEYAKPILKKIKERNPIQKTLVTFFSPSHIKQIENHPYVDYSYPVPFDLPGPTKSFISYFKPKKILFSRTDIWPELLHQAQKKSIPTMLFSRTQKLPSFLAGTFTPWIYQKLSAIDFVSKKDKDNFEYMCPEPKAKLFVNGDSRYDEVLNRQKLPTKIKPLNPIGFCLVLGSVWEEDLKAILTPDFLQFCNEKSISLIIAPHEYSISFQNFIKHTDMKAHLYSKLSKEWSGDLPLIVDQYGILFDLYSKANLSFVGGSFKKNVHSVMEPLAWGCPVVVGPKNKNNREAQEFKLKLIGRNTPMVKEIKTCDELMAHIRTIQHIEQDIKSTIQDEIKIKSGASQLITDWIFSN